ncbi:hypothetical protein HJG60_008791 [Phyllostomus discolor]|uniref:Uncharacterized protein n=1 Tax=Phyllostomus discolor TaxID=89673 RepID=A0A834DL40_9CHIR|nr:hypothetical protein HJG60_008791 [Phyllostomus discolor]
MRRVGQMSLGLLWPCWSLGVCLGECPTAALRTHSLLPAASSALGMLGTSMLASLLPDGLGQTPQVPTRGTTTLRSCQGHVRRRLPAPLRPWDWSLEDPGCSCNVSETRRRDPPTRPPLCPLSGRGAEAQERGASRYFIFSLSFPSP